MAVRGIDHVNIGTHQLEETRDFFRDVLGLTVGWRPDFAFAGVWLYAEDAAVVHLVDLTDPKRPSEEAALDHFAFSIDDFDDAKRRLDGAGVRYRSTAVPGAPIRQIFLRDPNGVSIELNCRAPAAGQTGTPAR